MARTNTILDLPNTPRWDPEKNVVMRKKRGSDEVEPMTVRNPYTAAQKKRQRKLAKLARERVDAMTSWMDEMEDVDELMDRLWWERQITGIAHELYSERFEELVAEELKTRDPDAAAELAEKAEDEWFLSASRVRQIKSRDSLNSDEPSRHQIVAEMMDEETLRDLYWEQEKSIDDIAEKLDVHPATVTRYMDKFGIERRSPIDPLYLKRRGSTQGTGRSSSSRSA